MSLCCDHQWEREKSRTNKTSLGQRSRVQRITRLRGGAREGTGAACNPAVDAETDRHTNPFRYNYGAFLLRKKSRELCRDLRT